MSIARGSSALGWLAALVLALPTDGLFTASGGADVAARSVEIAQTAFRITVAVPVEAF